MLDAGNFSKLAGAVAAAGLLSIGSASATTVNCPAIGTDDLVRYLKFEGVTGASCFDYGTVPSTISGETGGANQQFELRHPEYIFIGKDDYDPDKGTGEQSLGGILTPLNNTSLSGGSTGMIEFDAPSGYFDYILVFKWGKPDLASWAAISVTGSFENAVWTIMDVKSTGDVQSNIALSGTSVYAQIPLPATGWLMLSVLGLGGLVAHRKRKQKMAA